LQAINPEQRQNLYFIFKEAIANIVKHSNASMVDILLERSNNLTTLMIKDNGSSTKAITSGQGLLNIKMRAKKLNGDVTTKNENGFEIKVTF
jgi:signal transduction histidine kinase